MTGGVTHDYHGRSVTRHFGDPQAEYAAATEGVAVFDRSHRTRLRISGKAPAQMLGGVLTGTIPGAPTEVGEGVLSGIGRYQAVLTPKGKMLSDAWLFLLGDEDGVGFLLDVPVAGREPLMAHLAKFLPPRFARVDDISEDRRSLSVVGPGAAEVASRLALDSLVGPDELTGAEEGRWFCAADPADHLVVVRTEEVWPPAFTLFGPAAPISRFQSRVLEDGARPAGLGVWSTLRVEAGRPVFGTDMDERTLPPEAGIEDRAIDHGKGCYTGQEVIVRIRDRGHVNRYLRRLVLGEVPSPATGAELIAADGSGKVVGRITSVVESPKLGGVAALAYVARGVDRVLVDGRDVAVPDDFPDAE